MDTMGVYGKLPGLGDFVNRRLPRDFVQAIDTWMQSMIGDSRELLGEGWLEHYLGAPIWRFVLGPGTIGDPLWLGALVPSVDRVGRYFPFVVATPAPWQTDVGSALLALESWHDALERHCLHALEARADFDGLDAGLQRLVLPRRIPPRVQDDEDDTLPLPRSRPLAAVVNLGEGAPLQEAVVRGRSLLGAAPRAACLWSAQAADGGTLLLVTEGLPNGRFSAALVDGSWQQSGWECIAP